MDFIGLLELLFYYLHIFKFDKQNCKNNLVYLLINFIGSGIACFASILMKYLPFVILERSWAIVSIFGLLK